MAWSWTHGLTEKPFENQTLPSPLTWMWRCDQMECVKRYWCEVIGELLGLFPHTREFHLEAQYDGGRVHRWAPAEERLYPYHMNGKLRVVYDVNPPTSRDVPAGTPANSAP